MNINSYENYEEKLVAYIDIIGWKEATQNHEEISSEVKKALKIMDEQTRIGTRPDSQIISEDFEIGLFSDGMVVTISPQVGGHRIFSIGNICRKLLAIGFLCRGGITLGYCYHQGNRLFGPAINRVVELEKEAKFPRILLDDTVLRYNNGYLQIDYVSHDPDEDNKAILNLFPDTLKLKDSKSLQIEEIKQIIDANKRKYKTECDKYKKWKAAEKLFKIQTKNFTTK